MKYKVKFDVIGAEIAYSDSEIFEAENDMTAKEKANELIAEAQRSCNEEIESRFYHYKYKITGLFRVNQEEVAESVSF